MFQKICNWVLWVIAWSSLVIKLWQGEIRRCCILGCTCPDTTTSLDQLGYNCFVISYITLNLWYVFTIQVSKLKWNDCAPNRHRLNSAKALLCVTWCCELTVPPTTQYLRHKMCIKRLFTVYRVQKVWKVFFKENLYHYCVCFSKHQLK